MPYDLTIEYLGVSRLRPFANNARTHSKKQVRQIADSIKAFGFTNPVLIDDAGTILAGHGRVAAAKLLGMKQVPCVRLSDMSPSQKRASSDPPQIARNHSARDRVSDGFRLD